MKSEGNSGGHVVQSMHKAGMTLVCTFTPGLVSSLYTCLVQVHNKKTPQLLIKMILFYQLNQICDFLVLYPSSNKVGSI